MPLTLFYKDAEDYTQKLARFVRTALADHENALIMVDCAHPIHQYAFSKMEWSRYANRLWMVRAQRDYELLDALQDLPFTPELQRSQFLFITPHTHLSSSSGAEEQWKTHRKLQDLIARLEERFPIHVVLTETGMP